MNGFQETVDKIISDVSSIILEQDVESTVLFKFNGEYEGNFSEMLKKLMFEERIVQFFYLILLRNKREDGQRIYVTPAEKDLGEFLYYFFSDIKMSLLKDALINLCNYFSRHLNEKKYLEIQSELFYNPTAFRSQIENFVLNTGITDYRNLETVINEYEEELHVKVPKLVFPWYAYALCHTYQDFPYYDSNKKIFIVNGRNLSLKWLGRSDYPKESRILVDSQKKFRTFIHSLDKGEGTQDDNPLNKSLNLYLFNETTNLYDLFNIVSSFRDSSPYLAIQRYKGEKDSNNKEARKQERFLPKKKIFYGVSQIAEIKYLGVKTFLIDDYYSEELFLNSRIWPILTNIFRSCKNYLYSILKERASKEYETIPEDFRVDYYIYHQLYNQDPYIGFIEDALERGIEVYRPSSNNIETHLYEGYFYVYKFFYEKQFKGKRLRNFEKY